MEQFETASEKISIVTGYGGIAYETALALAARGDTVILAGRDPVKGAAAVKKIQDAVATDKTKDNPSSLRDGDETALRAAAAERSNPSKSGVMDCFVANAPRNDEFFTQSDDLFVREHAIIPNIIFEPIDLFEPESIRSFAGRITATYGRIDTIMCIAGVMMPDELSLTSGGVERQFAVNYLGHYELVGRLMHLLMKSNDPRVVTMSSVANRPARFDLRDATAERGYDASVSYALSKLCCLMYAIELSHRNPKIKACCVHPGFAKTQLFNRSKGFTLSLLQGIFFVLPIIRQSAHAAAKPAIFAATSPNAKSGAYYGPLFTIMGPPRQALTPTRAKNPRLREELWTLSERLTGVKYGYL